ncbi:MAG: DUF1330 domain-containing protein [bacterium]
MVVSAYVVANVEVTDPAAYEEYRSKVPGTIAAYGGRYLARSGAAEVLEGDWSPKRFVILEFPSLTQLKVWYKSPEYRPLLEIRKRTARTSVIIVEGI